MAQSNDKQGAVAVPGQADGSDPSRLQSAIPNSIVPSVTDLIALPLSALGWKHDVTAEIETALMASKIRMKPAGEEEAAKAIDLVAETIQYPTPSAIGLRASIKVLAELPRDVLWMATKRVIATWIHPRFPPPGAWNAVIAPDYAELKGEVTKLLTARSRIKLARLYHPENFEKPVAEVQKADKIQQEGKPS